MAAPIYAKDGTRMMNKCLEQVFTDNLALQDSKNLF
jgi:hypothetical protein